MRIDWHGNEYLVRFEANEVAKASERYAVASWLPGYELLGLRGWDDLIVRGPTGVCFTVPTVPMLSSFETVRAAEGGHWVKDRSTFHRSPEVVCHAHFLWLSPLSTREYPLDGCFHALYCSVCRTVSLLIIRGV